MPWRVKRLVYLLIVFVVMIVLSLIVYIRDKTVDNELLASIGVLGAIAIAIVALLPTNGQEDNDRK